MLEASLPVCPRQYLLPNTEGLVVEVLDELAGHLVRVVGIAVHTLLLQEINLHYHGAHTLLGFVKLVVCHCRDKRQRMCRF